MEYLSIKPGDERKNELKGKLRKLVSRSEPAILHVTYPYELNIVVEYWVTNLTRGDKDLPRIVNGDKFFEYYYTLDSSCALTFKKDDYRFTLKFIIRLQNKLNKNRKKRYSTSDFFLMSLGEFRAMTNDAKEDNEYTRVSPFFVGVVDSPSDRLHRILSWAKTSYMRSYGIDLTIRDPGWTFLEVPDIYNPEQLRYAKQSLINSISEKYCNFVIQACCDHFEDIRVVTGD